MLAALDTRRGASISKISSSSCGINRLDWMKGNKGFPSKSVNDLKSIKAESPRPESMNNLVEIDSDEESVLSDNYHLHYTCRKIGIFRFYNRSESV